MTARRTLTAAMRRMLALTWSPVTLPSSVVLSWPTSPCKATRVLDFIFFTHPATTTTSTTATNAMELSANPGCVNPGSGTVIYGSYLFWGIFTAVGYTGLAYTSPEICSSSHVRIRCRFLRFTTGRLHRRLALLNEMLASLVHSNILTVPRTLALDALSNKSTAFRSQAGITSQ